MKPSRDTTTGSKFETLTDIQQMFIKAGYTLDGNTAFKRNHKVSFHAKRNLYQWLENAHNIVWSERISSQLLPDDAIYNPTTNVLTIVEKKFQQTSGSADEKLQTASFKRNQYQKLFKGTGITVRFCFLLNKKWFDKPKYVDVLQFIKDEGHDYFFDKIPLVYFK